MNTEKEFENTLKSPLSRITLPADAEAAGIKQCRAADLQADAEAVARPQEMKYSNPKSGTTPGILTSGLSVSTDLLLALWSTLAAVIRFLTLSSSLVKVGL